MLVLRKADAAASIVRMRLLGANPRPAVEGKEKLPGKSHYFLGSDRKRWRTNVPQYARVEYKDVYPGVSLAYYGNQSQLEYDFVVNPGADPGSIRLGIDGADEIKVDADGNLHVCLPGGEMLQRAPVVYQELDGVRQVIDGRFVLRGRAEVGFEVGHYQADRPLVLDPSLIYSTYLGGSLLDVGYSIAVDASGNAYITGSTDSTDFPTANALQADNAGGGDAFVAKLNAAGSALVYSTYLGGSSLEQGYGIAVDASGNAYVIGMTLSTDFPTANPVQAGQGGASDAFLAKLDEMGSALVYSTYLGGMDSDLGLGIAVDPSGSAYVTGFTASINFPTANPLQADHGGAYDAFVTKLSAAGSSLVYSTFLGGMDADFGGGIAVDASGNAYVAGSTLSTDFPIADPFQAANAGRHDAFIAKLNTAGSALVYSTYLGGNSDDLGNGIAVDASANAYVVGQTGSVDFPTVNPLQAESGGSADVFVAKLNAAGSALRYSTYLGGTGYDLGRGIAVDVFRNAHVTGRTDSTDFPTRNAFQPANAGDSDAFVAKLSTSASGWSTLVYSSYLGGSRLETSLGIAVDSFGNAYVAGGTESTDFPTVRPFQGANAGGMDAFLVKIGARATGGTQGPGDEVAKPRPERP
jgi:hypothetical protein